MSFDRKELPDQPFAFLISSKSSIKFSFYVKTHVELEKLDKIISEVTFFIFIISILFVTHLQIGENECENKICDA
jgi:hypothetical protein